MRKSAITLIMALSLLLSAFGVATTASAQNAPYGCEKIRGTIVCQDQDEPSRGWTTNSSKKGSVNSSHPEQCTVTNPGGNPPPGRQSC